MSKILATDRLPEPSTSKGMATSTIVLIVVIVVIILITAFVIIKQRKQINALKALPI